ncbi:MAG TPA: LptE family protein [Edaphocola sp.]|nr:LptE family protein [Edaphocola sp.]
MNLKALKYSFLLFLTVLISGCGFYSFTGASIQGKSFLIHNLENTSSNILPSLSATLTSKIRNRILTQTGLTPVQNQGDYELSGIITQYNVSVSGLGDANTAQASQNRLTIAIQVDFKSRLNEKSNFKQTFSKFADFPANEQLSNVENKLIEKIGNELADEIFNKAFVNW